MNNSIYKRLLSDMTLIIIMPVIIVIIAVCSIVCYNYYSEQYDRTLSNVSQYALRVQNEMMSVESKSESILKYNYNVNNLTREYKDNYDRLEVTLHVASYLESVMGENVTIYLNIDDVFQSKYILPIYYLENYKDVYNRFEKTGKNLYWDDELYTDEKGSYFLLYRKMTFNKDSVLLCKAYIPEIYTEENNVTVAYSENINDFDVKKEISAGFYAVSNLDRKTIGMMISIYILLFAVLGVLVTFAMLTFSRSSIKRTTQDIDNFITKLKDKDVLNYDFQAEVNDDEVSELAVIKRTMGAFVTHIKELSYGKYETELERKKLEVDLLQSKIDPHLLYNSLTVIKLEAMKKDDKRTIEIVDNLVSYYRAVLSRGRQYVSLSGEIELLNKLVKINEISNGKTYEFKVNVPEELKEKTILHLMLQPFLENSLVHGFSGRRENCRAEISCSYDNGYLIIKIYDNGYGVPEKTLRKLNDIKNYDESYGIKNVYTRILLEYGEKSEITFQSEKDKYTEVTLKIPYEL